MDIADFYVETPPTARPSKLNRSRFSLVKTYTTESPRRKRNGHDSQKPNRPHHTPRIMGGSLPKDKPVHLRIGVSSAVEYDRTMTSAVSSERVVVTPSRPASSRKKTTLSCATVRIVSPPLPSTFPPHNGHFVYLIRHGESKGQLANSFQRRSDSSLVDCGLSALGQQQAVSMKERHNLPPMDMVLSSPLTRALQTAVLAFPTATQILVHYDLREFGGGKKGSIPENQPRPWNQVFADLPPGSHYKIDLRSLARQDHRSWPIHHDTSPNVLRRRYIQEVFRSLAAHVSSQPRPQHIAVVCHFHVIRAALTDPKGFCDPRIQPINATPLSCYLTPEGRLIPC